MRVFKTDYTGDPRRKARSVLRKKGLKPRKLVEVLYPRKTIAEGEAEVPDINPDCVVIAVGKISGHTHYVFLVEAE
jgi:hypothetical protein